MPTLVSLDHFRSRVYRQRLALVLLLLALGFNDYRDSIRNTIHPGPSNAQSAVTAAYSSGKSTLIDLGNQLASPSSAWSERIRSAIPDALGAGNLASSRDADGSEALIPSTSSAFSPKTLLLPTIFPTLVQLHALWLVRLFAGEIEGRSSGKSKRIAFWPTLLAAIALLAATAAIVAPQTAAYMHAAAQRWSGQQHIRTPTTFPALLVLLIEAVPTLLSLVPLALLLFPTRFPAKLNVPSPSHSPSLLEMVPFWVRAPFMPSERARARQAAIASGRSRRHGAFGRPLAHLAVPPREEEQDSLQRSSSPSHDTTSESYDLDSPVSATSTDAAHAAGSATPTQDQASSPRTSSIALAAEATGIDSRSVDTASAEGARLLRLQQEMLDELERAGKLPASARSSSSSAVAAAVAGKASLRRPHQVVSLPSLYIASLALMVASSLSLIVSYAAITMRLPTISPTSLPAVIALLALRAEIGLLAKSWNVERRKMEGLEFVRRRWGRSGPQRDDQTSATSSYTPCEGDSESGWCAICFESIDWLNEDEDGVRLDCQHELHAPCLVPWLMSQAFCPVCHRALRPGRANSVRRKSTRRRHGRREGRGEESSEASNSSAAAAAATVTGVERRMATAASSSSGGAPSSSDHFSSS